MAAIPGLSFLERLEMTSLLMFLVAFLTVLFFTKNKTPKNFPPGPWSLPVVGNLLQITPSQIHLQMAQFSKKYGNIFSFRIGAKMVVISGLQLIKEAFVKHGNHFADRPSLPLFEDIIQSKGLSVSNGYSWKQQRRFALSTLKTFGLGKKSLESQIQVECRVLNEVIGSKQGKAFDPRFILNNAVANIISCLVFGDRFEYSDSYFQQLLKLINEALYLEGSIWAQVYNVFPSIMRRMPGPHRKIFSHWETVISFIKLKIKEHKDNLDPSSPRDYIDRFLSEMEKWKDDADAGFSEDNLCYCTLDLFVAGTETTSTTLSWALLYMMKYPDVQEKVQAEIDQVLGPSRLATMADRVNMPYTDAVIHEIQRMGNIVPLNGLRMTGKDIILGNYTIPKGTMVMAPLNSVLFDETEWETPFTFNPGHFLDVEGNFRKRDAFLPFSIGKRVCLGEHLARKELFLFFTSLFQQFTFSVPPGAKLSMDFKLGVTRSPKPYKLCAVPR